MNGLSKKQLVLYYILDEMTKELGFPPSRRELTKRFGNSSLNSITQMLEIMRRKGFVDWTPKVARSIKIIRRPG